MDGGVGWLSGVVEWGGGVGLLSGWWSGWLRGRWSGGG